MVYINQHYLPIIEPLQIISSEEDEIVAEALFPYEAHEMNGLNCAVGTTSEGPFPNAKGMVKKTLTGPPILIQCCDYWIGLRVLGKCAIIIINTPSYDLRPKYIQCCEEYALDKP